MRSKGKNGIKALLVTGLLVFAMLAVTACGKEIAVNIVDGQTTTEVTIGTGKTVADALTAAGVTVGEQDQVTPAADTKITEDLKEIVIARSITVTIKDGTDSKEVTFTGTTVEEALKAAGITLSETDTTSPKASDTVKSGDVIEIKRVTVEEEVVEEKIPFEEKEEYSDAMFAGESKVTQKGKKGKKEITYKVTYVDGVEESREVVSEKVVKEPVDQIVTYGTAQQQQTQQQPQPTGRYIVSQEAVPNCADGSHGYYVITYSDGTVEYQEY